MDTVFRFYCCFFNVATWSRYIIGRWGIVIVVASSGHNSSYNHADSMSGFHDNNSVLDSMVSQTEKRSREYNRYFNVTLQLINNAI